ncbi:uncharacterized protein MONOS_15972 [Monocercomonoides exilis]|uniref:uncharacterized protein n=1 Tax=Monocercomonoides exilis TaxID=2049356 RepID=UPI00355A147B|nr:hypothetical protein MONOS_15972 [Monocercomonoides exilis]|eukprot:MONOS_15972.1-p1 / transcript=MONOS_15972.1 / gene=MONOS_15972 / organism=Monocercomonoides_exilis_PA203 / gene_product=unspecified product / transcript_product=unspecified product / location=Mono_scaffold01433:775-5101(-) / protein_length=1205 / sequence_SO=supercontig / SO=protein_coding / is_pseudo=false
MLCAGEANEVKVEGGTFDGCFCSVSNGFGGGIHLQLMNENPNFLISSSFGTNTAKWGKNIFVLSPKFEVTAKSENITCVTTSLDSADKVRGYDNGNTSAATPLCIYLHPTPEEIYVSNIEASNHSHCGTVQFPCLTMKHSLTRQTGTKKVVVNGMIMMSDELDFIDQKHEIRENDDESGWTVSDSSSTSNSSMISANVETELSKLILSLPSSLPLHSTFISSSSSSITLSRWILIIDKFSASSIDLRRNPLILLRGSGTNTKLVDALWLNMTKCNFSKIERAAGNGGCVNIDNNNDENSNTQINIEENVFDGCSVLADGSRGGAIDGQVKGSIQINIISCTFTGCTAPAEERRIGFGGGMALKLIDDDSSFVISSPIFEADKPNIAKYGNDLFVESPNLTKSITNTSLPSVSGHLTDISLNSMMGLDGSDTTNAIPLVYFWIALGSEIFVGGEGKDMGACDEAVMKIQGITNFELMNFVIPSSFTSGVNYLMHVGSSNGLLTVKDCSFTKKEDDREEIVSYGLIKTDGGTVQLEFVSLQSLSFSKDIISVLSATILNIKNLTMKNVELEKASGLRISKSSRREKNKVEQDVVIEWSSFEEVTQNATDDIPIIRNTNDEPLKMVMRNTTMKKCGGTRGRYVYVRCHSIGTQIVDEQFLLDFRTPFVKERAMWGCTTDSFAGEEDLLLRVVKYQSEMIFVSSIAVNHEDNKQCGEFNTPCQSLDTGVQHIIHSSYSQLLISKETVIVGECEAMDLIIRSLQSSSAAMVYLNSTIDGDVGNIITTTGIVRIESVKFNFGQLFSYSSSSIIHESSGQLSLSFIDFSSVGQSESIESIVLNSTLLNIESGILHVDNCSISMLSFKKPSFLLNGDEVSITNLKFEQIESTTDVFEIGQCGSVVFNGVSADGVKLSEGCIIEISDSSSSSISIKISSFNNCSRNSKGASVLSASSTSAQTNLSNCSCSDCDSLSSKGSIVELHNAKDVSMDLCQFIGVQTKESENERNRDFEEICKWNGSLVYSVNSSLVMKYVTIMNASSGGLSVSAGDVTIEKGELMNNNPFIEKLVFKTGDVELVETYPFEEDGFVSETEVIGRIPSENITAIKDETEVSVMILFGKRLVATSPQIAKNKTEPKTGNDKVVEGGKEGKSYLLLIVIIMVFILLFILIIAVISTVRWRKAKNEANDLREIVNDTVRKDPKLIEMVTMEG